MSYFVQWLGGRWVAGEDIASVVKEGRRANRKGIKLLVNYLGEHYKERTRVEKVVGIYLEVLENIRMEGIRAELSLKPSEIGMDVGKGYFLRNLLEVVHRAREVGVTVWLDMEEKHQVRDTIEVYLDVLKGSKNIAITLQANLVRTRTDLLKVLEKKGRVRLVKGAYQGDFDTWETENQFLRLMRILFSKGDHFAIATHDLALIEEAELLQGRYRRKMEFHFLRGVREGWQRKVARKFPVAVYTPFGQDALPYVWRRVKERVLVFG